MMSIHRTRRSMTMGAAAVAIALALTACTSNTPGGNGDGDGNGGEQISYKFGITIPGVQEAFYREAFDRSNEKHGYNGTWVETASSEVAVAGVASNEFQVSAGVTATAMAAQQAQGADLVFVGDFYKQEWTVAGREEYKNCDDLDGVRFGLHSPGGVSTALFKAWVEQTCSAGKAPQTLYVEGSDNRLQGLLANQLDAAMVQANDTLVLDDGFHVIADFAQDMPEIAVSNIFFNGAFAKEHPEVVENLLIEMLILVNEFYDDYTVYADLIRERTPDFADIADITAKTYVERGMFYEDGGTRIEDMQTTLDLYESAGAVEPGLVIADIVDRSYLEAALEAIK